jgi:CHAD domain-containing protein
MVLFLDLIDLVNEDLFLPPQNKTRKKILQLKKHTSSLRDYQVQKKIFKRDFGSEKIIKSFFIDEIQITKKKLSQFLKRHRIKKVKLGQSITMNERCFRFYDRVFFDFKKKMISLSSASSPIYYHDLRKLLKRLIYLTDIFHSLGYDAHPSLAFLQNYQKKLGELQDLTTTLEISNEILGSCPQHFRKIMIDYRLKNQMIHQELTKSVFNQLMRSSLCQN